MRRPARVVLTLLGLGLLPAAAILIVAGAGQAPATIVARLPATAAVLTTAPERVELTLSGDPDLARSHVSVSDSNGRPVDAGSLTSAQPGVLRRPVLITGSGDFTVAYHLVLTDAAQLTGSWRFSVGTGSPPASGPSIADGQPDGPRHDHGVDPVAAVALVADAVVLGVVAVLLVIRPRRGARHGSRASG